MSASALSAGHGSGAAVADVGLGAKLSGTERLWWLASTLAPPFANQLVVEGEGSLPSEAELGVALGDLTLCWPVLRRAVGPGRAPRWSEGLGPAVRTVAGSAALDQQEGMCWWLDPLGRGGRPLAEVVRHEGPRPALIFRLHHALGDGRGTLLWAQALCARLRGEAVAELLDLRSDEALVGERGVMPERLPPRDAGAVRLSTAAVQPALDLSFARRTIPAVGRRVLPRLVVAVARLVPEGRARIDVSVDLRAAVGGGPTILNRTGLVRCDVPRPFAEDAVDHQQKRMTKAVAAGVPFGFPARNTEIPSWPPAVLAALARGAAKRAQRSGRGHASATVSNFGLLDLAPLRTPDFRARAAWFLPPGSPGLPLFLTATGYEDTLDLVAAGPRALHGPDLGPVLARIIEHLRHASPDVA